MMKTFRKCRKLRKDLIIRSSSRAATLRDLEYPVQKNIATHSSHRSNGLRLSECQLKWLITDLGNITERISELVKVIFAR